MTEVIVASAAGACYGVERALGMVSDAVREGAGRVRTLGPLIHNPRVVADLEGRGISVVEHPDQAVGDTLLLRTHGVTPEVEGRAKEVCDKVLDATCPFVKNVHAAASRLAAQGYQVVVVGEAGHPEVEATLAHAPGAIVLGSAGDAAALGHLRKAGVVVQTTARLALLEEVVAALLGVADEVRVINTICEATSSHQASCEALASEVDVMVVIGGRNSANTTRLAEIAASRCQRTHHIEDADEIGPDWFVGARRIGITAGASTPASQIEAVRTLIVSMVGD